MASKRKQGTSSAIAPGDELVEGVAVRLHDDGWLIGRLAGADEKETPAGHTLHEFGDRRVFLSRDQAPIPADRLHRKGS